MLRFQRAQDHRKRSPDAKDMPVFVLLFVQFFTGPEVPVLRPEFPAPRKYPAQISGPNILTMSREFPGRPGRSGGSGNSGVSAGNSGPRSKNCPQRLDLVGTYLRGLLPQWFPSFGASLTPPLLTSKALIPLNPSNDSCPNLGIQERRSTSTSPPIKISSK